MVKNNTFLGKFCCIEVQYSLCQVMAMSSDEQCSALRILELGAGVAIPGLACAQMLGERRPGRSRQIEGNLAGSGGWDGGCGVGGAAAG